jgi:hypothetical protein
MHVYPGSVLSRLGAALVALTALGLVRAAAGAEPRAIIDRAIRAQGGRENLGRQVAVRVEFKARRFSVGGDVPLTGESYSAPGPRRKTNLEAQLGGQKHRLTSVLNGKKGWLRLDSAVVDLSRAEIEDELAEWYVERVIGLVDLVKDRGFTLTESGPALVNGRPAVEVKVSHKGQPDVSLFFDRDSGLLVKYAVRVRAGKSAWALEERVLSDYRELDRCVAQEQLLKAAGVDVTGPALRAFLRRQAVGPAQFGAARKWVRRLGSDSFAEREEAGQELVALGPAARVLLQEAARDSDLETARRARECLERIDRRSNTDVVIAAVQLLTWRRMPGTAEALLDCLPGAEEPVAREVRAALAEIARAQEPPAVLVRALADRDPVRRAAAEAVLGRDGGAYLRQPGRRLYLRGRKEPRKITGYRDGESVEYEVTAIEFFNDFEDKVFAKP